ncbi:FecR domain-containing protein [Erythrobacter sp. THAF29]|uniref:FecR family protein n=1 Tax=Erythrobacter sp. THAF29 TaxID=2587851 RepID=UPI001562593B|nr:FecR family protein [Erythrobacter sp. THAF29]
MSTIVATPATAQRTEVGAASSVVGKVSFRANGTGDRRSVVRKQRFAWGDLITTEKKSQLQILLLDRSTFGVGARTQVRIDRYVYDPDAGRSGVVTLIKGVLRFFSGIGGDNSAEVNTPAGRIGIRGTAVDMLVGKRAEKIVEKEDFVGRVDSDEDEATLVVLRGPGADSASGLTPGLVDVEGAGVVVTLDEPGLAAYIPRAGAAPIGPFRISDKGLVRVQEQLAPEVKRANDGGGLLETLLPIAVGAVALGVLLDGDDDSQQPDNPNTVRNPNRDDVQRSPNSSNRPPDN